MPKGKKTVAAKAAPAKVKPVKATRDKQTATQIIRDIADDVGLTAKQIKEVFESLAKKAESHLMKRGSGEFKLPGLGVKLVRKVKPATKKREGRNPFTGETIMIAAKKKTNVIKASILKSLKEIAK